MKLLANLTADRRKVLAIVVLILAVAALLRFYHIDRSFSNNGVDEGIMLERARMVGAGYALYTELPCDQAPLAFILGSFVDGDVVALRTLTASLSIVAIAACMLASKKQQGNIAMIFTGVLLAVDFSLLRESRLFSLDGLSASFLAISLPLYMHYLRKDSRIALFLAGVLVGVSTATKLFGGIALVGMLLFMVIDHWSNGDRRRAVSKMSVDILILVIAAALPILRLMLALGPSAMLDGMLFDQGHRESDLTMKLSIPIFFGLNAAFALPLIYARRVWRYSREARFLLILTAALLVDFVVQPLIFLHHLVIMSPGLAILAGMFISRELDRRKGSTEPNTGGISWKKGISESRTFVAISLVGILVSAGLGLYGVATQQATGQALYAEKVAEWTGPNDMVISGDPLITAYAQRLTPPELVNVGTRIYPMLTLPEVEDAVVRYDVSVFLLSYRFLEDDMTGLAQFLIGQGYVKIAEEYMGAWNGSAFSVFEEAQAPMVFVRGDIATSFHLPTEALA